jgi:hypothetical protein
MNPVQFGTSVQCPTAHKKAPSKWGLTAVSTFRPAAVAQTAMRLPAQKFSASAKDRRSPALIKKLYKFAAAISLNGGWCLTDMPTHNSVVSEQTGLSCGEETHGIYRCASPSDTSTAHPR